MLITANGAVPILQTDLERANQGPYAGNIELAVLCSWRGTAEVNVEDASRRLSKVAYCENAEWRADNDGARVVELRRPIDKTGAGSGVDDAFGLVVKDNVVNVDE